MCCTLSGMLALLNPVEPALDELFYLLKSLHAALRASVLEQVVEPTAGLIICLLSSPPSTVPLHHGPPVVHCQPSRLLFIFPCGQSTHSILPREVGCPVGP